MDFDFQWLLIGLPIAFALGWTASRIDLRQWRRDQRESPRAYFKGLNLLLNEQQDQAIDAFIEAVQNDPDTAELHFALGNLFRRRGEFERAVRVHQHLLARGDLKAADRHRAQHALAQDFMKAGLIDRAEAAWRALEGTSHDEEARRAQLTLAERSRDWPRAAELARSLQARGGAFATRIAHYECEMAEQADAAGRHDEARACLARARAAAPDAARPLLLTGRLARAAGDATAALAAWEALLDRGNDAFLLVASDYAATCLAEGRGPQAHARLAGRLEQQPAAELLDALEVLEAQGAVAPQARPEAVDRGTPPAVARRIAHLLRKPTLSAAQGLLAEPPQHWGEAGLQALRDAVAKAARPLHRYRCAACGFEAQHYFWQCPGCLNWESYPPQRIDAQ